MSQKTLKVALCMAAMLVAASSAHAVGVVTQEVQKLVWVGEYDTAMKIADAAMDPHSQDTVYGTIVVTALQKNECDEAKDAIDAINNDLHAKSLEH